MAGIEPIYPKIGRKIEKLREEQGVTQEALAFALGLTRAAVSSIERGKQRVLIHQLIIIASALKVSTLELLPTEFSDNEIDHSVIEGELAKTLVIKLENIQSISTKIKNLTTKGGTK